jgi:hypothetical protein
MLRCVGSIVGFAVLMTTVAPAGVLGQRKDLTRGFQEQKCQYTLIGDDWTWREPAQLPIVFSAENKKGTIVVLVIDRVPLNTQLTQALAEKAEASTYADPKTTKRGGRFITFQGQPSYQAESRLANGNTMACRIFLANGFAYTLGVVGGKDPVENEPDFEKIMSGFAFTEPPVTADKNTNSDFGIDSLFGLATFLIAIVLLIKRFRRDNSPPQRLVRIPRQEFDDELDGLPVDQPSGPVRSGVQTISSRQREQTGIQTEQPKAPALQADTPWPAMQERWADPALPSERRKDWPSADKCRHCDYRPVAYGAKVCPQCQGENPNPSVISRFAGRGTWIGVAVGVISGVIWGYFLVGGAVGAVIGGLFLGPLAGMFVGLCAGLIAGFIAKMSGKR